MRTKIARRLTLYFAMVLLLFGLIAGVLFSLMFMRHTVEVTVRDMRAHAVTIADTLSHFMANYHEGSCVGGGFKSYTRFIGDLAMSELYLTDAAGHIVTIGEMKPAAQALPQEAQQLISRIFEEREAVIEPYLPGALGAKSLMTGAPVWGADGEVLYALILHCPINTVGHALADTIYILGFCLCISMLLAVAVSRLVSGRFVMPLYRMMDTTTRLIGGDYCAHTGVVQDDEIGVLASHIDQLSAKLDEAEQERRQMEQMRQDFFSDVSHELRTPIAVLKGNVELLRSGMITEPKEREATYHQLYADTVHIQNLVNDLLELARLQNPHFRIDMEIVNLADILSDTVRSMRQKASEKRIAIRLENQAGPLPVMGDYRRLRQLMIILLDNAIKFSPEGSEIFLAANPVPGGCEVSVTDHGAGIDKEKLEHIFDRYYHDKSTCNSGGTGLGLPIAREIALRHRLEFSCESEPGRGTRFVLVFTGCAVPED